MESLEAPKPFLSLRATVVMVVSTLVLVWFGLAFFVVGAGALDRCQIHKPKGLKWDVGAETVWTWTPPGWECV